MIQPFTCKSGALKTKGTYFQTHYLDLKIIDWLITCLLAGTPVSDECLAFGLFSHILPYSHTKLFNHPLSQDCAGCLEPSSAMQAVSSSSTSLRLNQAFVHNLFVGLGPETGLGQPIYLSNSYPVVLKDLATFFIKV